MASSKEYLAFVMSQLSDLEDVSCRPMMGEYVLYVGGKVFGGIYDDRLLIKPTKSVVAALGEPDEIPYEGAKPMSMPDPDDREALCELIRTMVDELPAPKPKKKK
jgi:TfoX/Sxy family transcriptional regulator of competence genes